MNCNICIEKFNKMNRKIVKCKCGFECCRNCIKIYLLDKLEDAHCMSCKVAWDRAFLSENFEKTWINKIYKEHRENVLLEREMSMLQATQVHVEREIKLENLQNEILEYSKKIRELENELYRLRTNKIPLEKKKFIRKCPNGDCKGFLSTALKCELCNAWACAECRELVGFTSESKEQHVCEPQILENVKAIVADSKPCPNCAAMTFKIIGCNQMYCVECNTPWDWKSGRIITGTIHNPHYFEYLQRQNNGITPRNPNDILCGREIDNYFIRDLTEKIGKSKGIEVAEINRYRRMRNLQAKSIILEIARTVIHTRLVEQPRFINNRGIEDNLKLRVDYMRNKISKEHFKYVIQKKEKSNKKNTEINNVLAMYISCMTDILYRKLDNLTDVEASDYNTLKVLPEIEALRIYTNECFNRIGCSYNSKIYEINARFEFK